MNFAYLIAVLLISIIFGSIGGIISHGLLVIYDRFKGE